MRKLRKALQTKDIIVSATGLGGETQETNPKTGGLDAFDADTKRFVKRLIKVSKTPRRISGGIDTKRARPTPEIGDACVAAGEADRLERGLLQARRAFYCKAYGITEAQWRHAMIRRRQRERGLRPNL